MESYKELAKVYDLFMQETPYNTWVKYIESIFLKYNLNPNLILELGCGTGNITSLMHAKGYDMIGVDISEDMLIEAKEKAQQNNQNILFLNQDMCEFELYGTVDSCICICDSLNYILETEDILKTFKLVNNYLNPKGLFIFDLNTEFKFKNILGNNSFSATEDNAAYIWENYYYEDEKINEYYTNIFIEDSKGKYNRHEEYHYQKAYTTETIVELLKISGLEILEIYDAFTFNKPKLDSERIIFIAQENTK